MISPNNKLLTILDFDKCKKLVEQHKDNGEACAILCPIYSINIASKYKDGEALQYDLDELEAYIGANIEVSQYDDLIANLSNEDA